MVTGYRRSIRGAQRGFTLIEVIMVVVVVGILAAIAMPAYQGQVRKGHRSAAQAQMLDIANREQQYLLANRTYAEVDDLNFTLPPEVAERYDWDIDVGTGTVPSYTIEFTAKGAQTADGDLTLDSNGVKTPADKW